MNRGYRRKRIEKLELALIEARSEIEDLRMTNRGLRALADRRADRINGIHAAWNDPGPVPWYHEMMQRRVRRWMPVLGRELDGGRPWHGPTG